MAHYLPHSERVCRCRTEGPTPCVYEIDFCFLHLCARPFNCLAISSVLERTQIPRHRFATTSTPSTPWLIARWDQPSICSSIVIELSCSYAVFSTLKTGRKTAHVRFEPVAASRIFTSSIVPMRKYMVTLWFVITMRVRRMHRALQTSDNRLPCRSTS